MNLNKMAVTPRYNDGIFDLYEIVDATEEDSDFPVRKIKLRMSGIQYRTEAIYDRTRLVFEQAGKDVTMKIRIPKWDGISSSCVCVIDGVQHKVFNKTDVLSKQGFPETELTLETPEQVYEVES
mgnify:CR=1 FL=1